MKSLINIVCPYFNYIVLFTEPTNVRLLFCIILQFFGLRFGTVQVSPLNYTCFILMILYNNVHSSEFINDVCLEIQIKNFLYLSLFHSPFIYISRLILTRRFPMLEKHYNMDYKLFSYNHI